MSAAGMQSYEPKIQRRLSRISIRGVDYAVNEWGEPSAPLLVYLHGWGDTGSTFQFVVDELAGDWFVVAPDWRGFGGSSGGASAYWFPNYLADLDHLLTRYTPTRPARLLGHSMGGNVASLYAGVMPERVEAFINLEGFGLPDSDPGEAPARYREWIQQSHAKPALSSYRDFGDLTARISKRNPAMTLARAQFVAREWAEPGADGRIRLRVDPAHKLPSAVLYRRAEAEACWRAVRAEVLVLVGSDSEFASVLGPDSDADAGRLPFPRATIRRIDRAGHMLHFDRPDEVARHIDAFFAL